MATNLIIGQGTGGVFNQAAGTTVNAGNITVGASAGTGSSATGGTGSYVLGTNGAASLQLSGGTLTVGGLASTGTMTIQFGSSVTSTTQGALIAVGNSGTGALTQISSTVSLTGVESGILVGVGSGGVGTYNFQSGSITATGIDSGVGIGIDGGTGTLTQSNGTLTTGELTVGEGGAGVFQLFAGTVNVQGDGISISTTAGSTGTVNQFGGAVTSGGVVTIGTAGPGTYNFLGGSANFEQGLTIGSHGIFNQGASINLSNAGTQPVSIALGGVYNLNAGTLVTGGSVFGGAGNLNFAGGAVQVTGASWNDGLNSVISGASTINTGAFNTTLSGNLSGTGSLLFTSNGSGTSTVTLSNAANSGSWGATIAGRTTLAAAGLGALSNSGTYAIGTGSTLQIGVAGTRNSFAGTIEDVVDGFDPNGVATFGTGSNKLILSGLTSLSTHSRTILGAGGSLEVDNGTISNVQGGAGNASDTVDIGSGSSAGTVQLLGTNTIPQLTVNPNATLLLTQVTGNVTYRGTLGTLGSLNTPVTATINGALSSSARSTMIIHANGLRADEFTGVTTADLSGRIGVSGVGNSPAAGFVIVNTTGGVTDNGLTTPRATALFSSRVAVSANGDQLLLFTTQKPTASFAQSPNERAVGESIDNVINRGVPFQSTFLPLLGQLNSLETGVAGFRRARAAHAGEPAVLAQHRL
ncbi:MAG: hypothetical protein WDO13_14655 [Verrucomicrobiota bacterium]